MIDFIKDNGLYICIGLGIICLIVVISILINYFKSNKTEEEKKSILDVDIDGVVEGDFTYGYEKEDTIVMKPVENETKKKTTKKNTNKKK